MIADAACAALSVVLIAWCCASSSPGCRAPRGWYVNGVRPSGVYELRPVLGDPDRDIEDGRRRVEIRDPRWIRGAVVCTGGATPRQDGTSVWCQR